MTSLVLVSTYGIFNFEENGWVRKSSTSATKKALPVRCRRLQRFHGKSPFVLLELDLLSNIYQVDVNDKTSCLGLSPGSASDSGVMRMCALEGPT